MKLFFLVFRTAYDIIRELQKRYLGHLPLIKVELYCDNIMKCKEECYTLTSLVLDLKYSSILSTEEKENDDSENRNDKKYRHKFKMQVSAVVKARLSRFARVLIMRKICFKGLQYKINQRGIA